MVWYPIYNLELAGWGEQSIWGWDPSQESYYAQLTPDTSDREAESEGPEIWVSPPRYPVMPDPAALAEAIAGATRVSLTVAQRAMNDSLEEGDPLRQPVGDGQPVEDGTRRSPTGAERGLRSALSGVRRLIGR